MSRRRDLQNPFDQQDSDSDVPVTAVDSVLFSGKTLDVEPARQVAKPLSILRIMPDPLQPRRVMPSDVRSLWNGTPETLGDVLGRWYAAVVQLNPDFDLLHELTLEDSESKNTPAYDALTPIEANFLQLCALAASIRRDGLLNPITVIEDQDRFRLETGERRWLAYHLLHAYFDGTEGRPDERRKWEKIPARIVGAPSVWRQASENSARESLNAIARARQFAILLMDLAAAEKSAFLPFQEVTARGLSDRVYYAQIADQRVPTGKNEMLIKAMGLTNRSQLSHYRAFLTLPDEVWRIGDDYSLTDEFLYRLSKLDEQSAIEEARKIVVSHNNQDKTESAVESEKITYPAGTNRHFSQVSRAITKTGPGKQAHNQKALHYIEELEAWLSEQKARILAFNS